MKPFLLLLAIAAFVIVGGLSIALVQSRGPVLCWGMCDASATISLNNEYFAVADDEETAIRVFPRRGGNSIATLNIAAFLGLPKRAAEVDIEGAARIGEVVYWISSHGCNAKGKPQPSRRQFFATTGRITNEVLDLQPVGRPYTRLLEDLIADPALKPFDLQSASERMPKGADALNIEGLCATPEGHLLIGFRNPIPQGKALLVPLLNPRDVISSTNRARFGAPLLLELGGLGIRSIDYQSGRYLIVAGSFDGEGPSLLFEWAGGEERPRPIDLPQLAGMNPEALTFFERNGREQIWIVSDDGKVQVEGRDCKRLKNPGSRRFRAMSVEL